MPDTEQHPDWGPHVEWAVRYSTRNLTGTPTKSPIRFMTVANQQLAERAVRNRIPGSGDHHTVVRRTVSDWEEA